MSHRGFAFALVLIFGIALLSAFFQVSSLTNCFTEYHQSSSLSGSASSSPSSSSSSSSNALTKRSKNNDAATDVARPYDPASTEAYILEHAVDLGLHQGSSSPTRQWKNVSMGSGCEVWRNESVTNPDIFRQLHEFKNELEDYNSRVKNFTLPFSDLRHHLLSDDGEEDEDDDTKDVCNQLELHPDGLQGIFRSHQLSFIPLVGYAEPLLPPMRHPKFCENDQKYVLDLSYLVHDMAAMCRKLKPTSRIVLIDMGASLTFHGNEDSPAVYLVELYRKFGMPFDHIFAFEMKQTAPKVVFDRVPDHWMPAYHWINVGVSADTESKFNAYNLLDKFNDDDLIVVKLDIDTSSVEMPLAKQLLQDKRLEIVDQFYFEHHVFMKEISRWWVNSMAGTVQESLELFSNIRKKGIAAHFWV